MDSETTLGARVGAGKPSLLRALQRSLWQNKFALISLIVLLVVVGVSFLANSYFGEQARKLNLSARNSPPFRMDLGWQFILGADALGRSLLARIIVAGKNTLTIAALAVLVSMTIGSVLGMIAGYNRGWVSALILRLSDAIMSFPSMLLAVTFLYIFEPGIQNVIIVLAISRIPIFTRTVRAEVLEIRERLFVISAVALGASRRRIIFRHIFPAVLPTITTLAVLEIAFVMLVESGLSFLGIGIQPPEVTWGLMVADGRSYLNSAWWLSFWPGLMITVVTLALNGLAGWLRRVTDPAEQWKLFKEDGGDD